MKVNIYRRGKKNVATLHVIKKHSKDIIVTAIEKMIFRNVIIESHSIRNYNTL